jgi:hypothetical protein
LALAIVAAIAVAGVGWYVVSRRQAAPSSPATVPIDRPAPAAVAPPPREPLVKAADIDLPALPQTDSIVRELVAGLSSHPTIAAWLATDRLIANFTVATLAVAEGRTPAPFLRSIAPRGPFRTARSGEELLADARAYERYNPHGDAIAALDAAGAASLYLTLEPRITEAYRELGYPEGDFDRVLERAIGVLLRTPELDERMALRPKAVTYAYGDPSLEGLMPAQKQLLRMGPRNGRIVRAKLAEIARLLELQPLNP